MNQYHDWQLLFLGMGDYCDSFRPSIRKRYQQSVLNEDEHIANSIYEMVMEHIDGFHKLVSGTEGKWLGLLEGHHYFDFGNGTTSDTLLADKLQTRFLGDCTMSHLKFDRNGHTRQFIIWAHHGEGSGQLVSSPLNKLEHLIKCFDADCFLMAHQHKAVTSKRPWLYTTRSGRGGLRLTHKDRSITCTGGWLQGYQQDSKFNGRAAGHYPEQKMLTPISIGGTRILIYPEHTRDGDYIWHEVVV